jgi:hypothetical protein
MRNWKTSFFGITTILSGIANLIQGDYITGFTIISTGLGLLFAKDHNIK